MPPGLQPLVAAPIDEDGLAGDAGRGFGGEPDDGGRNLLGLGHAANGDFALQLALDLFQRKVAVFRTLLEEAAGAVGGRKTRPDVVDGDAVAPKLAGQGTDQTHDPGADRVREDQLRNGLLDRVGGERDDASPVLPLHVRDHRLAEDDGAAQVELPGALPFVECRVEEGFGRRTTGVGDADVDAAEPAVSGSDKGADGLAVADVEGLGMDLNAEALARVRGDAIEAFLTAGAEGEVGSLGSQSQSGGAPDAEAGTRNDGHSVFESGFHGPYDRAAGSGEPGWKVPGRTTVPFSWVPVLRNGWRRPLSAEKELQYTSFDRIPVEALNPLIDRQFVYGERTMLARLVLRKGALVPEHSHENEQITYVVEGALRFRLGDGRVLTVRAGEVLVIPSNLSHQAEALEDTLDLDVFAPPRADWIAGTDAYLRKKSSEGRTGG